KQTAQPGRTELTVEIALAVLVVPRDRMPRVRRMHPRLVHAPGVKPYLHQGRRAEEPFGAEGAFRGSALLPYFHHALAAAAPVAFERRANMAGPPAPAPAHQSEILLLYFAIAQHRVQSDQHGAAFGDQQAAGRSAIQTMDQFEHGRVRPQLSQRLDHSDGDATT